MDPAQLKTNFEEQIAKTDSQITELETNLAKAKEYKMICFSSAFDETSVDFLNRLRTPAFKIASFEINHVPLIKKIANTKKPVILSSGMATFKEIKYAIKILKENGCNNYAVLKCTSNYPADPSDSIAQRRSPWLPFADLHRLQQQATGQPVQADHQEP